jgi:hypothetical protein
MTITMHPFSLTTLLSSLFPPPKNM